MKRILLYSGICLLALLGIGGTLQAQTVDLTPVWPLPSPYFCSWTLNGNSGWAFVTLTLNGNNSLRRGTIQNTYASGATTVTRCTVTKPVEAGSSCTQFEFTNNDNGIQCKDTVVCNGGRYLHFLDCSNGAEQYCYQ